MNGRTAFSIALPAAVLLTTGVGVAPACAADGIGLSPDGVVWYDALHRPLFDPAQVWVPGDAEVASFFARNDGPTAARLSISVRDVHGVPLPDTDDIEITARAGGGPWRAVGKDLVSSSLTDSAIERGGRTRVDVRVRFLWRAPNDAMLARLPLDFEVRLVQAGQSDDVPGGPGSLPDTGSALSRAVIWLGAVLVGGGLGLLAFTRRRRSEDAQAVPDDASAIDEEVRIDG